MGKNRKDTRAQLKTAETKSTFSRSKLLKNSWELERGIQSTIG